MYFAIRFISLLRLCLYVFLALLRSPSRQADSEALNRKRKNSTREPMRATQHTTFNRKLRHTAHTEGAVTQHARKGRADTAIEQRVPHTVKLLSRKRLRKRETLKLPICVYVRVVFLLQLHRCNTEFTGFHPAFKI